MEKESNKLNRLNKLKGNNPFLVPEGYMEGLTSQIMSHLPEKSKLTTEISFMQRVRPWLYLAAVFIGLGLFFRAISGLVTVDEVGNDDDLLVQTKNQPAISSAFNQHLEEEDADYLDYLEILYADCLIAEEFSASE